MIEDMIKGKRALQLQGTPQHSKGFGSSSQALFLFPASRRSRCAGDIPLFKRGSTGEFILSKAEGKRLAHPVTGGVEDVKYFRNVQKCSHCFVSFQNLKG